jgi:hypothetical protein
VESLTPRPGIREQNRSTASVERFRRVGFTPNSGRMAATQRIDASGPISDIDHGWRLSQLGSLTEREHPAARTWSPTAGPRGHR